MYVLDMQPARKKVRENNRKTCNHASCNLERQQFSLHELLLATRFGPNFFAIPRGAGFRNRLNLSSGKYNGTL